jgi:acyl-CoA synthetase (AMP-forming)/AMP-acid ligase II
MLSDTDLINKYYKQINALKLPSQFKIERISIIRNNFPHTASGKVIRSETIKLLEKG